jgi:pimeloyl-ACP methyl ester carboxylesterase
MASSHWSARLRVLCGVGALALLVAVAPALAQQAIVMNKVPVGTAEIAYRDTGTGRDRVAFFLHPLLNDSRMWLDQLHGVCAGRRCIAMDFEGHGYSSPLMRSTIDLEAYARQALGLLDALKITRPVDVVAFAASGVVAAHAYNMAPGRFRSMTLISSVFIDEASIGEIAMATGRRYRQENARLVVIEGKDAIFRRFNEYILSPQAPLFARARYKSMLEQTANETVVAFMQTKVVSASPDLLKTLELPVMMPVGADDPIIPMSEAEEMRAKLPQGRIVTIEQSGRLMPLEAPEALNQALMAFWTEIGK